MATCTSVLTCDGEQHRITWRRGALVLEDHADPLAELALAALGAPWSPCIALLSVVRGRFDPVGTWPVWDGPLPRASGPELMLQAWRNLEAARRAPDGAARTVATVEDRWAMTVLGMVDPALRRRLALDAVVGRCRRALAEALDLAGGLTARSGFNRRDGRGTLAESILLSSIGAPPGDGLVWLLESSGDARARRLRARTG